jgi:dynactin-5
MFNYYQMKLGDFVTIGQNCIVEASSIGSGSEIEDNCIIVRPQDHTRLLRTYPSAHLHGATIPVGQGEFVNIKDFVIIEEGTVLSPNTVCPNLTRWAGNPGQSQGSLLFPHLTE